MRSTVRRTMAGMSAQAVVVISPQTRIRPVVVAVSQATRAVSSWAIRLSRMASLIWSHSLSGWPSVTLSLVKNAFGLVIKLVMCAWVFSTRFLPSEFSRNSNIRRINPPKGDRSPLRACSHQAGLFHRLLRPVRFGGLPGRRPLAAILMAELCPRFPGREILFLLWCQGVDLDAHADEFE